MELEIRLKEAEQQLKQLEIDHVGLDIRKNALEDRKRYMDTRAAGLRYEADFEGSKEAKQEKEKALVEAGRTRDLLDQVETDLMKKEHEIQNQHQHSIEIRNAITNRDCLFLRRKLLEAKINYWRMNGQLDEMGVIQNELQIEFNQINLAVVGAHISPDRSLVMPMVNHYLDYIPYALAEMEETEVEIAQLKAQYP